MQLWIQGFISFPTDRQAGQASMVVSLSQARRVRRTGGQQKLEPTTVTWSEVSMFFVSFFPNESRTNVDGANICIPPQFSNQSG